MKALGSALSVRPHFDGFTMTVAAELSNEQEMPKSPTSLLQHSFNAASAATGLPVWAVRAVSWPVFKHPGVAASLAALDAAASYSNLADAAASYVPLRSTPISLVEVG